MRRLGARMALAIGAVLHFGCGSDPAVLDVTLVGPAFAAPQYFHGNCPAGWTVRAELRVAETGGVDVQLESLNFRISDSGSGQELGSAMLDGSAIEESFGPGARIIPGGGERTFPVSALSPARPTGPLAVTGSLSARDEHEARVQSSFRFAPAVEHDDSPPPAGGACAQPPG